MTRALLEKITNSYVKALTPYASARRLFSGGKYWLNANESPYSNEYTLDSEHLNRYPDCQPTQLKEAYAEYNGVNKDNVLITRGADEGIELLIRAFCTPGEDSIAICPPTYGMYAISAQTFDVAVTSVPLLPDFSLDMSGLETVAAQENIPKVVFLCSPNNPTGTRLAREQIEACLALFSEKSIVVLDEAYIEFSWQHRCTDILEKYPNLVILRTMSKAFALAGLRCGYTLASTDIIEVLLKVIAPYPVPAPVAQIAQQALSNEGIERMRNQVKAIQNNQTTLVEFLNQSDNAELIGNQTANFVLFRHPESASLMAFLVEQGMLIRDQSKQLGLQNCLRITTSNESENERFMSLYKQFEKA